MLEQLKTYEARFDGLVLRERILVVTAVLALIAYVWWATIGEANSLKQAELNKQVMQRSAQVAQLEQTLSHLRASLKAGIKNNKKIRLESLDKSLAKIESELKLKATDLIDPDEMFAVLSKIVSKHNDLSLLSLKRVSVKSAVDEGPSTNSATDEDKEVKIYRHSLQVSLLGGYSQIAHYLHALELLDWQLIWDSVVVETNADGKLVVTLQLSTLSTQKKWVGI